MQTGQTQCPVGNALTKIDKKSNNINWAKTSQIEFRTPVLTKGSNEDINGKKLKKVKLSCHYMQNLHQQHGTQYAAEIESYIGTYK